MNRLSRNLNVRNTSPKFNRDGDTASNIVRPGLRLLDAYMRNEPPLPHVPDGWKEGMSGFLRMSRMNYAELAVGALSDRMVPRGWVTSVDNDINGDQVADAIANANDIELVFSDIARCMLALGDAYAIVGAPRDNSSDIPTITAESALNVITEQHPQSGEVMAALKIVKDDWTGNDVSYLYLPGHVYVASGNNGSGGVDGSWEFHENRGGPLPAQLADVVPVVPYRNLDGVGEFERHLDVLDRINEGIFDRIAITKFQAFRQRAVKNLPMEDETGQPVDYDNTFLSDPGSLWMVPEGVDFWESSPIDLGPLRMSIKDDVEAFAIVTRTPLHMISPDAANGSAAGAETMREGFTFRVEDRRRRINAGNRRLLSMAFRAMGDTQRADVSGIRTLWNKVQTESLANRAQSFATLQNAGVPREMLYVDVLDYPPSELPRIEAQDAKEKLQALAYQAANPDGAKG